MLFALTAPKIRESHEFGRLSPSRKNRPRSLQLVKLNLQESPPPVPDYLERTNMEPPEGRVDISFPTTNPSILPADSSK